MGAWMRAYRCGCRVDTSFAEGGAAVVVDDGAGVVVVGVVVGSLAPPVESRRRELLFPLPFRSQPSPPLPLLCGVIKMIQWCGFMENRRAGVARTHAHMHVHTPFSFNFFTRSTILSVVFDVVAVVVVCAGV